ncbi:MAG: hypothetical protein IAI48_18670 [Candidatus Eremiobacteraeota bacterium]|nr:hypothetical protein [Candidatus Eremiobacteraeota bacterium]
MEFTLVTLPTGSVVRVLGAPERAEPRYRDAPLETVRRADAWFWACGCSAEPAGPGRFAIAGCPDHRAPLQRRFERKSRGFSTYAPAPVRRPG